jgi:hypothetical protein
MVMREASDVFHVRGKGQRIGRDFKKKMNKCGLNLGWSRIFDPESARRYPAGVIP